eukprot:15462736-Alexandrium_andersonii.AAC.1
MMNLSLYAAETFMMSEKADVSTGHAMRFVPHAGNVATRPGLTTAACMPVALSAPRTPFD